MLFISKISSFLCSKPVCDSLFSQCGKDLIIPYLSEFSLTNLSYSFRSNHSTCFALPQKHRCSPKQDFHTDVSLTLNTAPPGFCSPSPTSQVLNVFFLRGLPETSLWKIAYFPQHTHTHTPTPPFPNSTFLFMYYL